MNAVMLFLIIEKSQPLKSVSHEDKFVKHFPLFPGCVHTLIKSCHELLTLL